MYVEAIQNNIIAMHDFSLSTFRRKYKLFGSEASMKGQTEIEG